MHNGFTQDNRQRQSPNGVRAETNKTGQNTYCLEIMPKQYYADAIFKLKLVTGGGKLNETLVCMGFRRDEKQDSNEVKKKAKKLEYANSRTLLYVLCDHD